MEKEKSYEGLTIRIPSNIAEELKELKDEKDLSSYGLALQYWVRQQMDEEIKNQLINLEKKTSQILNFSKGLDQKMVLLDMIIETIDKQTFPPATGEERKEFQKNYEEKRKFFQEVGVSYPFSAEKRFKQVLKEEPKEEPGKKYLT